MRTFTIHISYICIYDMTMLFWSQTKLHDWRPVNYGICIQIFAWRSLLVRIY